MAEESIPGRVDLAVRSRNDTRHERPRRVDFRLSALNRQMREADICLEQRAQRFPLTIRLLLMIRSRQAIRGEFFLKAWVYGSQTGLVSFGSVVVCP